MYRPCETFDETYSQTMAIIRTRRHWILTLLGLAALMTMPLYLSGRVLHFVNLLAINMIAAQGLNLLTGFAGQISLAQSAFMAVGAYSAALMTQARERFMRDTPEHTPGRFQGVGSIYDHALSKSTNLSSSEYGTCSQNGRQPYIDVPGPWDRQNCHHREPPYVNRPDPSDDPSD